MPTLIPGPKIQTAKLPGYQGSETAFSGPPDQTANIHIYGGLIDPGRPKTAFSRAPVRIIRPPNALQGPVWRSDPGGLNFSPKNATSTIGFVVASSDAIDTVPERVEVQSTKCKVQSVKSEV